MSQGDLSALVVVSIFCTSLLNGGIGANYKPVLGVVRAFDIPGDTCKQYGVPGVGSRGHRFSVWYMGNNMGSARHTMLSYYVVCLGFGLVRPHSVTQEWSTILSGDVCARCHMRAMLPWVAATAVLDYTYLLYSVPPASRYSSEWSYSTSLAEVIKMNVKHRIQVH
jgi:hypothetical protein